MLFCMRWLTSAAPDVCSDATLAKGLLDGAGSTGKGTDLTCDHMLVPVILLVLLTLGMMRPEMSSQTDKMQ